jgi:hypothetical protein
MVGKLNTIGKVCVVIVAAASLAFAAFAGAMRNGGPNWQNEADALGSDFILSVTPGNPPSYSMTYRPTNQNIGTSTVLAEVVTAAKAKQASEARDQLKRLQDQAEQFKPLTETALAANAADEAGLKLREEAMRQQLDAVSKEIERVNNEIVETAATAQRIRAEGQDRRDEVYRQKTVLELARNDLYAAQVQRKNLEEEEIRLKDLLQRLQRRKEQLTEQTGGGR